MANSVESPAQAPLLSQAVSLAARVADHHHLCVPALRRDGHRKLLVNAQLFGKQAKSVGSDNRVSLALPCPAFHLLPAHSTTRRKPLQSICTSLL